jgi:RimJ/RimL family protein N-acetyltransferase
MGITFVILDSHLTFSKGQLRLLNPDDVHQGYVDGLNDPEVNKYLVGVKCFTQTTQSVIHYVKSNMESSSSILWGIWQQGSKLHCGTVRLHGIDTYHGVALIGICLFDKTSWGNRIGTKAITAVTSWAHDCLKLSWIEAGVYAENLSSQKAFLDARYDWIFDISDKFLLDGKPSVVKIYAARKDLN